MRRIMVIAFLFVLCAGLAGRAYRLQNIYSGSYDNPSRVHSNSIWACITDMDGLRCWELQESGQWARILETALPEDVWGVQSAVMVPSDSVNIPDIWLASNAGLLNYSGRKWTRYREIIADHLTVCDEGGIWLIANGILLNYDYGRFIQAVSDEEWQTQAFGASCLENDREGYPWIGVMGPSIVRFNGTELDKALAVPAGPPSDLPGQDDSAPQHICFDADNNPWVDYPLGVACWKDGAWTEHDLSRYGFDFGVAQLAADDRGIIWASNGGRGLVCYDGIGWYEPEILGNDMPEDSWWIAQMTAGPDGSMIFKLASEFPAAIKAYACLPVADLPAEPAAEQLLAPRRGYPPPDTGNPQSREQQGLKGPVKSVFSQGIYPPSYFSYREFDPQGRLILSSAGRSSMNTESAYEYDGRGYLVRERTIEYGNGEELGNDQARFEYEYDAWDYPLQKAYLSADGEIWKLENYSYTDSGYVKEWEEAPSEYSPGYAYRESYDGRGRMVFWTSTNLSDGSLDKREYTYLPDNQKIEWTAWNGSGYNRKRVVWFTPTGGEGNWTLYDAAGAILAQNTVTLNAQGDIVSSVLEDRENNTTSRTAARYTYDSHGNPLRVESTIDGEEDEWGSVTLTYEYY